MDKIEVTDERRDGAIAYQIAAKHSNMAPTDALPLIDAICRAIATARADERRRIIGIISIVIDGRTKVGQTLAAAILAAAEEE